MTWTNEQIPHTLLNNNYNYGRSQRGATASMPLPHPRCPLQERKAGYAHDYNTVHNHDANQCEIASK